MINKRVIIIYLITACVCASIAYFGILPNLSKSLNTIKQIGLTQKKLTNLAHEKDILTALSKNENLEKLLIFAVNSIPADARPNQLATEINSLIQNTGMTLNNKIVINNNTQSTQNSTNNSVQTDEANFSLNLTGDFSSFIKLLTLSEKTSRLVSIKNIDLTESTNNKITAQITGTAYWATVDTDNADDVTKYEVATSTIKKLQSLTEPEPAIITPAETGFGRLDPFANIKN